MKPLNCPENPLSTSECSRRLMPVKDTLELLNGKWKLLIILALRHGEKRFKELQRETNGITSKMLSKELKELEINGLVKRTVIDTMPVSVTYSVTEYAQTLDGVIDALYTWGIQHRSKLMTNV